MNTYTDPELLDVAGAMEALPALPLSTGTQKAPIAVSATGTDDSPTFQFAPEFAPATGKSSLLETILDKITTNGGDEKIAASVFLSAWPVNEKSLLTTGVNRPSKEPAKGIEPLTPALRMRCSAD